MEKLRAWPLLLLVMQIGVCQSSITSLIPSSADAGGSPFVLTVNGAGFGPASQIYWNQQPLATNLMNPSQLTAQVTSGLLATAIPVTVTVNTNGATSTPLEFTILPEGVEVLLGVGSVVRGPISDYTINNNYLSAKNLGWSSPAAMVGLSFGVKPSTKIPVLNVLSVFASAQFQSTTSNNVVSYTVGFGFHVNRYLHLLLGYSLFPTNQPSPGFRSAVYSYVVSHPNDPAYAAFNASALRNNSLNAFDGFPVPPAVPANGFSYSGSILETKYSSGVFVGFAFPLSLRKAFQ